VHGEALVETNREGHENLAGRHSVEGERANRKAGRGGMLLLIHFLRAVDAAEADTFRALIVQDFEGVAVDHSHNSSGVVGSNGLTNKQ